MKVLMAILAALLISCLAVDVIFAAQSKESNEFEGCQNVVHCPCGRTNTDVRVCVQSQDGDPCKMLSQCKACQDGLSSCLECPEGLEGPFCSRDASQAKSRKKRGIPFKEYSRVVILKKPDDCSSLKSPKTGSISCLSTEEERSCTGKCLPGYSFVNSDETEITLVCRKGNWSPLPSFPDCKSRGECDLEVTGTGSFNCTTKISGTVCDVKCGKQYVGRYSCYPGKDWQPPLPRCVKRKGDVDKDPMCRCEYGATCDSTGACVCPVGTTGLHCETIDTEEICPDPGQVQNADRLNVDGSSSVGVQRYRQGQSVVYACYNGFALEGKSLITCLVTGAWSDVTPSCSRSKSDVRATTKAPEVRCPDPGQVQHADRLNPDGSVSVDVQRYPVGESVVYRCHQGFVLQRRSLITCLSTGTWSGITPYCTKMPPPTVASEVMCPDPGYIRNAVRLNPDGSASVGTQRFRVGQSVVYACRHGFASQRTLITCLATGSWSGRAPHCIKSSTSSQATASPDNVLKFCRDPLIDSNGSRVSTSVASPRGFPQGSMLEYSCNQGYTMKGERILFCGISGEWSASPPTCEKASPDSASSSEIVYCVNPGSIPKGTLSYSLPISGRRKDVKTTSEDIMDMEAYPAGTTLEYACEDGYELEGASSAFCESTGFWSADPPACHEGCGRRIVQKSDVTSSHSTIPGEWPWVVAISVQEDSNSEVVCGGVLLDSQTVLTVAHCLQTTSKLTLLFGKYHLYDQDDDGVVVRTNIKVIIHPDFDSSTLGSDIAVIKFEPRIQYTARIRPICLPTVDTASANLMKGQSGFVAGWGVNGKNLQSPALTATRLSVITNEECLQKYEEQNATLNMGRRWFCAGSESPDQTVCEGHSGSALVFYDSVNEKFTVQGLASFGLLEQCGLRGTYTVFTKVFEFLPWIYENME